MFLAASATAVAAPWRWSGPARPPAGESVTYTLRGPPGRAYVVVVFAGARACPHDNLPGDPAQTLDTRGLLADGGADTRQLSFGEGRSTICAYDDGRVVAGRVIRAGPRRDRLHIKASSEQSSAAYDAVVTATGYVGRAVDSLYADAASQHLGTVTVVAIPPNSRCRKTRPAQRATRTNYAVVGGAHFSVDVTLVNAFEASRSQRLCGYLTAQRRTRGGVGERTVARAQISSAQFESDDATGGGGPQRDAVLRVVAAWLVFVGLALGIVAIARRVMARGELGSRGGVPSLPGGRPQAGRGDHTVPVAGPPEVDASSPGYEFVQRRRDEEVGFAIQRAVGAAADVYRDRLRVILERQDGPEWLDAFNRRRRVDMLAKGHGPPASYGSFEPRAVLNCLAYDLAGLQLIDLAAVDAARSLCGLANAAHHPDPDKPLTDADYQRAWRLYSQITGYAAPFDSHRG